MAHGFYCGIDFGTSNSSIAIAGSRQMPVLVPVENTKDTIPSTIFYGTDSPVPLFGNAAIAAYINGEQGRFMRSLKRVLGTDLMSAGTIINGKSAKFENILIQFIKHLKRKAEVISKEEINNIVMGRPVHFRDNDPKGDATAENELRQIAGQVGFKNIAFQYEPIAAAYAHEANLKGESLACVVDIGGGTSDFTVIRLGSEHRLKADRSDDILASSGVRIGGNDFDKSLCISSFMPALGMKTTYGNKNLPVPSSQYFDLAEWSKVNSAYSFQNQRIIRQVLSEAHDKNKYARLLELVEKEKGHELLGQVEAAKIALTNANENLQILKFLQDKPEIKSNRQEFNNAIKDNVEKTRQAVMECLVQAQAKAEEIELIILTGGSTEIPYVQKELCGIFPKAAISGENKLSSVGLGLAYDSLRIFA